MTATKNNVPPNSTLVMTVLVLRTSQSKKPCTLRPPPICFRSTESTSRVVLLPRIHLPRTPVNKEDKEGPGLNERGAGRIPTPPTVELTQPSSEPGRTRMGLELAAS